VGPETDDGIAYILHEPVTTPIINAVCMLAAIEFHDKMPLAAGKIGEIGSNRELPDEFIAAEPPILEFVPEAAFGEIIAVSKRSRALRDARLAAAVGPSGSIHHNDPCLSSFYPLTGLLRKPPLPHEECGRGVAVLTASRKTSA
jgi:hypothetical protein